MNGVHGLLTLVHKHAVEGLESNQEKKSRKKSEPYVMQSNRFQRNVTKKNAQVFFESICGISRKLKTNIATKLDFE